MRPQRWKRKHTETHWLCFHLWFLSSFCREVPKMEAWPPFLKKKNVKKASGFWRNWVSIYLAVVIYLGLFVPFRSSVALSFSPWANPISKGFQFHERFQPTRRVVHDWETLPKEDAVSSWWSNVGRHMVYLLYEIMSLKTLTFRLTARSGPLTGSGLLALIN